uniref:Uncharacterized protein n=1 Tax=Cyanothece sp. (strain PCC 7425 / ATCC 29141) TaxID=395961 RepID=B8HZ06_CYAP4
MAEIQQRLEQIATQFGDKDKISIFLGRDKLYSGKAISEATLERLEVALRSPASESLVLRVMEGKELIYRSAKGEVTLDAKGMGSHWQAQPAPELEASSESEKTGLNAEPAASHLTDRIPSLSPSLYPQQVVNASHLPESIAWAVIEPQLIERLHSQSESEPTQISSSLSSPPGAIVLVDSRKDLVPFPLQPTEPQLDQQMWQILNPPEATNYASLEQALVAANARIDALQAQLEQTQVKLSTLAKEVQEQGLQHWAQSKVQDISHTSKLIAEQAKTRLMQWMQVKTEQVKEVMTEKVTELKTVTQEKIDGAKVAAAETVEGLKTAAQLGAIALKEGIRTGVNEFLSPVNAQDVERVGRHIVQTYGDGRTYERAATHAFHLSSGGEFSVTRRSDGRIIFANGELTQAADARDILKLNSLPGLLDQIQARQPQRGQQMEVGA